LGFRISLKTKGPLAGAFVTPQFLSGTPRVLLRMLIEFILALLRAKAVLLSIVLGLILGSILIHIHSANRIFGHEGHLLYKKITPFTSFSSRRRQLPSGNSCKFAQTEFITHQPGLLTIKIND